MGGGASVVANPDAIEIGRTFADVTNWLNPLRPAIGPFPSSATFIVGYISIPNGMSCLRCPFTGKDCVYSELVYTVRCKSINKTVQIAPDASGSNGQSISISSAWSQPIAEIAKCDFILTEGSCPGFLVPAANSKMFVTLTYPARKTEYPKSFSPVMQKIAEACGIGVSKLEIRISVGKSLEVGAMINIFATPVPIPGSNALQLRPVQQPLDVNSPTILQQWSTDKKLKLGQLTRKDAILGHTGHYTFKGLDNIPPPITAAMVNSFHPTSGAEGIVTPQQQQEQHLQKSPPNQTQPLFHQQQPLQQPQHFMNTATAVATPIYQQAEDEVIF